MRIGLLGGSFDPIHKAHIALALAALHNRHLDEVQLIPAGQPWQKPSLHATPQQRAEMIEIAINGIAALSMNRMELERSGATYTIDTLENLSPKHTYYWILGSDQLANFCSWHRWSDVAQRVTLLVAARPGVSPEIPAPLAQQIEQGRACVEFLPFEPMDVSANDLRQRIASGESFDELVDPAVAHYIKQHKLYEKSGQE
ncbi:nicotinate-nucleotide adenylyltransferase [Orrella marina]|uniref:Probable nicotinate-nucleotide adenylyltransferase n=1 Tax=Orrella marina TaxID=2163011 RepID=A0A2R4XG54_9BURK|nr:nicotinate-nucleotide adenylyltransferase [Orrella marina]AWB32653.1 nicotinate (nicotinamide) nucleotide adenylyltransferase [Orrella marina]